MKQARRGARSQLAGAAELVQTTAWTGLFLGALWIASNQLVGRSIVLLFNSPSLGAVAATKRQANEATDEAERRLVTLREQLAAADGTDTPVSPSDRTAVTAAQLRVANNWLAATALNVSVVITFILPLQLAVFAVLVALVGTAPSIWRVYLGSSAPCRRLTRTGRRPDPPEWGGCVAREPVTGTASPPLRARSSLRAPTVPYRLPRAGSRLPRPSVRASRFGAVAEPTTAEVARRQAVGRSSVTERPGSKASKATKGSRGRLWWPLFTLVASLR